MRAKITALLMGACLFVMTGTVSAHEQGSMMDSDDMHEMMQEMMLSQGMGMMGGGQGPGACGMDNGASAGMMSRYARQGMSGFRKFSMLNLTPEQRTKIKKIQFDLRKQHWALIGKILDNQAALSDLYAADRPDAKKIGMVYSAIFDIRRQMIEAQIEAMNRAQDILTKEQLERLKRLNQQQAGMMMPGVMGHEMMHEMMSEQPQKSTDQAHHPQ